MKSRGQSAKHLNLEAIWIEPNEIADFWDEIRPGLEVVAKKGNGWIPEDVYVSVKTGAANLHLLYDDETLVGFTVTTQGQDHNGVFLHVWATYSFGQNQAYHDAVFNQLDDWAMNIKAKKITFHSPRKGWEKVGEKYGYKPTQIIFEKKV